jgi:hypothetical protein
MYYVLLLLDIVVGAELVDAEAELAPKRLNHRLDPAPAYLGRLMHQVLLYGVQDFALLECPQSADVVSRFLGIADLVRTTHVNPL